MSANGGNTIDLRHAVKMGILLNALGDFYLFK
jgi:hypothetical protein